MERLFANDLLKCRSACRLSLSILLPFILYLFVYIRSLYLCTGIRVAGIVDTFTGSLNFRAVRNRGGRGSDEQYLRRQVLFCSACVGYEQPHCPRRTFGRTMKTSVKTFLSALDSSAIARKQLPKTMQRRGKMRYRRNARKQNVSRAGSNEY